MTRASTGPKDWIVAGSALIIVVLFIWVLAYPAFARIPGLESPGTIFVGIKHDSSPERIRVDVDVHVTVSQTQTALSLSLHGDPDSPVSLDEAGDLVLGFCGAIRDIQLISSATGNEVALKDLSIDDNQASSPRLGPLGNCLMTEISKDELIGTWQDDSGTSWLLPQLIGTTSAVTEVSAGAQHRYVLPSVVTTLIPFGGTPIGSVAPNSMVELNPKGITDEYIPSMARPALSDSEALE